MTRTGVFAVAAGPAVAAIVWRAGLLTTSGALAAACIGSASAVAGIDWMTLLLAFFGSSVLLGRVGRDTKRARSAAVIAKAGARDAMQVVANGGIFGGAALASLTVHATAPVAAIALGALAAATADTWGTEIGMLSSTPPRSIITRKPLEPGLSGGVSALGIAGTVVGAASLASLAWLFHWPTSVVTAGAVAGVIGAMADSVLGATLQQRRRSRESGRLTERTHDADGRRTEVVSGLRWLDNDGVNLLAGAIGAVAAFALHAMLSTMASA